MLDLTHRWRMVVAVLLLTVVARGGFAWWRLESYQADPDGYRELAENWSRTGVMGYGTAESPIQPTAFRPPGYPWLLSWFVHDARLSASTVMALHLVSAMITVGLVMSLVPAVTGQRSSGIATCIAASLVIFDPILLVQSTQVMTETLAALLAVWAWCNWTRMIRGTTSASCWKWGAALGVSLLFGFYVRPISIVWAMLLWLATLLALPRWPVKGAMSLAMLILMLGVGLWTWRNSQALGAPVWATTHGGYTLLLANNPPLYDHLDQSPWPRPWDPHHFFAAYAARGASEISDPEFWKAPHAGQASEPGLSELEDDRRAYRAARATIEQRPGTFLRSCVARVLWLWMPWPQTGGTWERGLVGCWYVALYGAALFGMWRLGKSLLDPIWWPALLLILTLTATHAIYWSNLRMRAPAIPIFAILAAATLGFARQRANDQTLQERLTEETTCADSRDALP